MFYSFASMIYTTPYVRYLKNTLKKLLVANNGNALNANYFTPQKYDYYAGI